MAKRVVEPLPGLYKNGARWWIRTVKAPLNGVTKPLSTGTADTGRANAVLRMVREFEQNPTQYEWLEHAIGGVVSLEQLYVHHASGTLQRLHKQLRQRDADARDPDLDRLVDSWLESIARRSLADDTKADYHRHIRALIPAGAKFPASRFAVEHLSKTLEGLGVSDLTAKHYVATWRLFFKYARVRVPSISNPFEDTSWQPARVGPRSTTWEFDTVTKVLDCMSGRARVAMSLIFGTGIELGALLAMRREHIGAMRFNIVDDERTIIAPGTKNLHRENRTIFVDRWAWVELREYLMKSDLLPRAPLFEFGYEGRELRDAFYQAQVDAGVIPAPKRSKSGKLLWAAVQPHRVHDARHTYCVIRSLGLDGEPAQDITYLSHQLGHGDEQMVMRIYKKKNIKERLRLLQLQRAQQAERAAK